MATTTNFGWTTPDDTDLVKDGASAIRSLGSAIDTSLIDLKGGTTGQVLSKASNTDMDFTWVTNAGDIEGVTAGTGISGGGTSGTVTITNSMATAIDAKGDLIVGTGADTFNRLAVGTNNYVLTADSAESTGLKWALPSGALTQLATGTLSGSSTDFSFTPTGYKQIWIVYNNVDFTTDPVNLYFRPNGTTGASSYLGFHQRMQNATYSTAAHGYNTSGFVSLTGALTANFRVQGIVKITNIYQVDGGSGDYLLDYHSWFRNSTDQECVSSGVYDYQESAALTKVTFATSASTFAGGTVTVYGVK